MPEVGAVMVAEEAEPAVASVPAAVTADRLEVCVARGAEIATGAEVATGRRPPLGSRLAAFCDAPLFSSERRGRLFRGITSTSLCYG